MENPSDVYFTVVVLGVILHAKLKKTVNIIRVQLQTISLLMPQIVTQSRLVPADYSVVK